MISQCWKWKILLDRSHFLNPSLLLADIYPNNTWHTLKWKKNPLIVQNLHLPHFSALENFQKFSKISIIIKNFKIFKKVVAYRIFSRISFTVIFLMFQNEKNKYSKKIQPCGRFLVEMTLFIKYSNIYIIECVVKFLIELLSCSTCRVDLTASAKFS